MNYKTHGEYMKEFREKGYGIHEARRFADFEVLEDQLLEAQDFEQLKTAVLSLFNILRPKM